MFTIQSLLKAPKGQLNSFGGYKYRSCEDIVEAVKPILFSRGFHLKLTDEVVLVGDRVYIHAIACVMDGTKVLWAADAYAREPESKKGMDVSQITGMSSSYARKYALNGLFAIDDTKDADTMAPAVDELLTDNQYETLSDLIHETDTNIDQFCKHFGIDMPAEMRQSNYAKAKRLLEAKLKNKAQS